MKLSSLLYYIGYFIALVGPSVLGIFIGSRPYLIWAAALIVTSGLIVWLSMIVKDLGDQMLSLPKITVPKWHDMEYLHTFLWLAAFWGLIAWGIPTYLVVPEYVDVLQWGIGLTGLICVPFLALGIAHLERRNRSFIPLQSPVYLTDLRDYERETIDAICAADPHGLGHYPINILYQAWRMWSKQAYCAGWITGSDTHVAAFIKWAKTKPIDTILSK